ncbi:MAG: YncE family protein [Planctomycetota bacterium]
MSRQTNRARAWLGTIARKASLLAGKANLLLLVLACASVATAQVPRERVFVANQTDGTISAFDTDKVNNGGDVVDFLVPDTLQFPALNAPTLLALNPMLHYGYATELTTGSLAVFDTLSNDNLVGGISTGGQVYARVPLSIPLPLGVCVTPDGSLVFVGNAERAVGLATPTADLVSVVDAERFVELGTIDVSVVGGFGPIDVCASPDGARIYVACSASTNVVVIDVATLTPLFAVALPTADTPVRICITNDNAFVYVACADGADGDASGEVAFFDVPTLTTGLVAGLVPGTSNPNDVFANHANDILYIVDTGLEFVLVVSIATQSVITSVIQTGTTTLANAQFGCINADDSFGFVTDTGTPDVKNFNAASNIHLQVYPTGAGPFGIASMALANLSAAGAANVQRVRESREDRNKGLCFVATASYGNTGEVASLRAFRDLYLMPTKFGRSFVDLYYESSPGVASAISGNDDVRASVRGGLVPVVWAARLVMGMGSGLAAAAGALLALAAGAGIGRRLMTSARRTA